MMQRIHVAWVSFVEGKMIGRAHVARSVLLFPPTQWWVRYTKCRCPSLFNLLTLILVPWQFLWKQWTM
jgi:hypothetical protein